MDLATSNQVSSCGTETDGSKALFSVYKNFLCANDSASLNLFELSNSLNPEGTYPEFKLEALIFN